MSGSAFHKRARCDWARRSGLVAMVVGACVALSTESRAQTAEEGRIGVGRTATVALHYHLITTGCRSGPTPTVRVRQQPRLGRLATRVQTVPLPAGGLFSNVGACAGRPIRAMVVSYTAGRRAGVDTFAYDFTIPRERVTRSKTVRVTIQ
jgi:hypothetical protein